MSTWGIIPAAGAGSRIQPLAFSNELLPVGSRFEAEVERPRAVSEYLIERMVEGGATRICIVIAPGKSDILQYYGARIDGVDIVYVVQPRPAGLCDALFRASAVIGADDHVLIGLPDTIWFPVEGFGLLPEGELSFLLFPARQPPFSEAVVTDDRDRVLEIEVKQPQPRSSWIWGAAKMHARQFHALHQLWLQPGRRDEHLGTLVNAYLANGGRALGLRSGIAYVDVGTPQGYREAVELLTGRRDTPDPPPAPVPNRYTDGWQPLTALGYARNFPHQRVEGDALHRSNR